MNSPTQWHKLMFQVEQAHIQRDLENHLKITNGNQTSGAGSGDYNFY